MAAGHKKPHGQRLAENAQELASYIDSDPDLILVRERGFHRFARETENIFKMVGVSDYIAWAHAQKSFDEITPTSVKKTLTGKPRASKEEVAAMLPLYIGGVVFDFDDESDAVALGICWLIQHEYIDVKGVPT